MTAALTNEEHALVKALADVWQRFNVMVGHTRTRESDLGEIAVHVHALQNVVLAQAAARAYPERYRLAGGVIEAL